MKLFPVNLLYSLRPRRHETFTLPGKVLINNESGELSTWMGISNVASVYCSTGILSRTCLVEEDSSGKRFNFTSLKRL